MRVLDLQRLERPLHAANTPRKCLTALLQLELCAKPAVAVTLANSQHMRVQIRLWISVCGILSSLHARQRHGETNHRFRRSIWACARQFCVKRSQYLASDLLSNKKGLARINV